MNQDKIWDYYQNSNNNNFLDAIPRYKFLASFFLKNQSVLNIGVGQAGLEKILINRGVQVSCLDPNEKSILAIRKTLNLDSHHAKTGYSHDIPFKSDKFEAVIMTEVLEHVPIEYFDQTLDEIKRVLKKNAFFIGTVPANEQLTANNCICPNCAHVFHQYGHCQSFSIEKLKTIFTSKNFQIQKIEYRAFPDWQRKTCVSFTKSTVRYLLGRLGTNIAVPNIFFIVKKN